MTASLPMPQDAYPDEPDSAAGAVRTESGRILELPPKPPISAEEAASAPVPAEVAAPVPKRPPRAPRTTTPRTPRAKPKTAPRPRARPARVDPGPPPPVPPDLAPTNAEVTGVVGSAAEAPVADASPVEAPVADASSSVSVDDIVVPSTVSVDDIVVPSTVSVDDIVVPSTVSVDDIVVPSTVLVDDIVVPPRPPLPTVVPLAENAPSDVAASDPGAEMLVESDPPVIEHEAEPGEALAVDDEIAGEAVADVTTVEDPVDDGAAVGDDDLPPDVADDEAVDLAPPPLEDQDPPGEVSPDEAPAGEASADDATVAALLPLTEPDATEPDSPESPTTETDADEDAYNDLAAVFVDDQRVATADEALVPALAVRGVTKAFGETRAVDGIDLTVPAGTFYGLVGPNGAGKTTTLSMIAGLLRPTRGSILVNGIDAAADPIGAKRMMGVLPDRLRTFDRLTGRQLLYYYGVLRGLRTAVVESRTADLARAFDLTDALGRVVSDYSAGMTKKVMLAGAMIHSPRLLVLDEPFEAVDPVSSAIILDILGTYVAHGGTVILSSHGMELVERVCSRVAVIVAGQVLAEGTIDEVRGELTLEQRFIELAGGLSDVEGLEWLHTFSD